MSGFRDSFTKDDAKDDLLGYDDTAFYYFASSVLLVIIVPWTFNVVYNMLFPGKALIEQDFPKKSRVGSVYRYCTTAEMTDKVDKARKEARRFTGSTLSYAFGKGGLVALWLILVLMVSKVGTEKEIKGFDPFDILEVAHGSDAPAIKKAYRKLSLIYHPDKNPDDPSAQSRFIQITKAYAALTDETAKANYEKYGNPDGPTTTKVGIGLPKFLLEKDNHLMILCAFFFVLLFVVPMTFICYYQRTKGYAANGVMVETLQFLGYHINEATRIKNCPELLAASAESRMMPTRPTDNAQMKPVAQQVVEHKKRQWQVPVITKHSFLLWGHMQRLHHEMSPELRADSDELLKYSVKITQAMIEIACMREWFFTAQSLIEFRRCLIQALDIKSSQLLQIPHFNEERLKHAHRGKHSVSTLVDFLRKDPEDRKGLANMEAHELQDVEAFAAHVSDMDFQANVEVEDEADIVVGDVATVSATLLRKNLREGEAMGPVHAPLFPEPKFEEWWLFLVEAGPSTRIITFERIRDCERLIEEKLRFQVSRPGKHQLVLHCLCDSYAGMDQKVELSFVAKTEEQVKAEGKREVFVHPEDEDLDLQPTLFQQFMGELNQDEESEEEDEPDDKKKDKKGGAASKDLGRSEGGAAKDDDSDDSEPPKKGAKDDDDSDSSDSSSDDEK